MLKKTIAVVGFVVLGITTNLVAVEQPKSIDEKATHVDSDKIKVPGVNAFCLTHDGQILAACGNGPGEVRVVSTAGKVVRSWKVDIKPEAINTTPDGNVLVAGIGKLMLFDINGKLTNSADSPHAKAMLENKGKLRTTAIQQLKRVVNYEATINAYQQMIAKVEAKARDGELSKSDQRLVEIYNRSLKMMEERQAIAKKQAKDKKEPSEEQINKLVESMIRSKMRIASISTDGKHTFVATSATVGYGYDVWKMNNDFTDGEQVVTGLRGCCGQMDVQCCESGIYVAENSRHRVVCFDKNGEEKVAWGKRDRTGIDGFTSCCNPMNVCFNATGEVFTAESNTGRIKRFSKTGEFIAYIGDVKLVPGCKNVSIAVSADSERVYMLDITRGHIVVMTKKPEASVAAKPDA